MFLCYPFFFTMSATLLLLGGMANSQEQWQLDQAAGKYWYAEGELVYTHDPKENNPGTMMVVPSLEEDITISILPDLEFNDTGKAPVRYAFNRRLEDSDAVFEPWSVEQLEDFSYLDAPQKFVDEFLCNARNDGFVEIEIIDRFAETAHRTFILNGYEDAFAELSTAPQQQEASSGVLGQWSDDSWGEGTTVALVEDQKSLKITYHFPDDSVFESELTEVPHDEGRRFNQNDDPTEWYVLKDDGRLEIRNARGIIRTLEP